MKAKEWACCTLMLGIPTALYLCLHFGSDRVKEGAALAGGIMLTLLLPAKLFTAWQQRRTIKRQLEE